MTNSAYEDHPSQPGLKRLKPLPLDIIGEIDQTVFTTSHLGTTDLNSPLFLTPDRYEIADLATASNAPPTASGPGEMVTKVLANGNKELELKEQFTNRTWKQGYNVGTGTHGGWTQVADRGYALVFGGTAVLDTAAYITSYGDVVPSLAALTDGPPGGWTGPGLIISRNVPSGTNKLLRTLIVLEQLVAYQNYYNGTAWTGWIGQEAPNTGELLSAFAAANSGNIGSVTPVIVPIDGADYSRVGFDVSISGGQITLNEPVAQLLVSYDVTAFLQSGVAATVEHAVYQDGVQVTHSRSAAYISMTGVGNGASASGSCVVAASTGDVIDVRSLSQNGAATFRTLGNACRVRLSRLA